MRVTDRRTELSGAQILMVGVSKAKTEMGKGMRERVFGVRVRVGACLVVCVCVGEGETYSDGR